MNLATVHSSDYRIQPSKARS